MAEGKRDMMLAMMIRETPLPMPYSSICSPIHMSSMVPAVSRSPASSSIPKPNEAGKTCTPETLSALIIIGPWKKHRKTVA